MGVIAYYYNYPAMKTWHAPGDQIESYFSPEYSVQMGRYVGWKFVDRPGDARWKCYPECEYETTNKYCSILNAILFAWHYCTLCLSRMDIIKFTTSLV